MSQLPPRVLLLDDSEITLEVARELLEEQGFEVRTALSIGELDTIVAEWPPDVIVVDVFMPGPGGPELCRQLKSRLDTKTVPIVLCSSLEQQKLDELARACGAQGAHSKADGLDALPAELRTICEAAQAHW